MGDLANKKLLQSRKLFLRSFGSRCFPFLRFLDERILSDIVHIFVIRIIIGEFFHNIVDLCCMESASLNIIAKIPNKKTHISLFKIWGRSTWKSLR